MIDREEMLEFAREFQLEPNVVEKDYALGWLLAGIANHPVLRDNSEVRPLHDIWTYGPKQ